MNKTVMICIGIFYLICLTVSLNLNLDDTITSMLPDNDPSVSDFKYIINNIPATEIVYLDIENRGTDLNTFKQAADFIDTGIRNGPYFSDILYQISNEKFVHLLTLVNEKRWVLLDEADLKRVDQEITQPRVTEIVGNIKRILLSPAGIFMGENLIKDPLNFNERVLSKLNAAQNELSNVKFEAGRIFSKDGKHLLMMAHPVFPAVDTRKTDEMIKFLTGIKQQVAQKFGDKIYVGISGNHMATYDNSMTIQKDVKRALIVLSMGILSIGVLFFSRRIYIVLVFIPTLVSLTFASSIMAMISHQVSAIALGCGAVLVGVTVDFGIHILFSVDNMKDKPVDEIISQLKIPIAAGAITTIAAFCCLLFSSLPGQRQVGLFASIGVCGAALFAVFLLKYFIPNDDMTERRPLISLVSLCNHLMSIRKKYIKPIAFFGALLTLASLFGIKDFKFQGDVSELNHLSPVTKHDTDVFLKTWGAFSPSMVLAKAETLEKALQKNDRLFSLLQNLKEKGQVDNVDSLSSIFPSSLKRTQNYEGLRKIFSEEKILKTERLFDTAAEEAGFSINAFKPFFDNLRNLPENKEMIGLTLGDFKDTAIEQLMNEKIIFRDNVVMVLTTFTIPDKASIPDIVSRIKAAIPGSMFLNKRDFVEKITSDVANEFKQLLFFAAFSVVIVVFIFFRNPVVVLITVTPVLLSAMITAGILGLVDIEINLISTIFVVFIFGIGIDFSIFLTNFEIHKHHREDNVAAGAVILCATSTMGAFACLVFANHNALFSIGAAGLIGMLTSLILSLILVPTLVEKFYSPENKNG
ncbi:MAG: MMPL family transporter [Proteobacteria bacterium]|nr:MMPL family transporter [Pseudomonadota bacterium]MBU4472064.1 MMPL family transporter [Pseudomonadota bacterium]MCG2752938.1 MMPL family transporter [Desulfobacteraceae bacterium]